jgi:hypothetical protein
VAMVIVSERLGGNAVQFSSNSSKATS